MTIEVDQSIKIEQSGATVLAYANGQTAAILIPQRVKRAGLATLLAKGKSREIATLLLFAAGLYLLLKEDLITAQKLGIDPEYEGPNHNIKSFLVEYSKKADQNIKPERIDFAYVGKQSPADKKARGVRTGKDKTYRKISLVELLRVIA